MALILSLETATRICSVALHDDGVLAGLKEIDLDKSHSEHLVPMIEQMLTAASWDMNDLSAVAVSMGPGSYTGLRIGTSTAKGFCYGLDLPLIAINTLMSMAAGVAAYSPEDVLLCPMIDARRMEVYCMVCDKSLHTILPTEAHVISEDSFSELLRQNEVWFFGNGSDKVRSRIPEGPAVFVPDVEASAKHMGQLGYKMYCQNDFQDLAYFEPLYLKEFRTTKPKPGL